MKQVITGVAGLAALAVMASVASAATLDDVKKKGFLQCGVNTGLPGFASPNDKGEWSGFDVDYCRAVAAAVFGDATKVKYTPLSAKERFPRSSQVKSMFCPQHHLDPQPRYAGLRFRWRQLL